MPRTTEQLYTDLKEDVGSVANPLFELSEKLIREHGNFLPHGFVLAAAGKDTTVGAVEGNSSGTSTSTATLPILHDGLRAQVGKCNARAIGVAESVTITSEGCEQTRAIKVLLEHSAGLCVAMYLPFEKDPSGSYTFGTAFTVPATPEVSPWGRSDA